MKRLISILGLAALLAVTFGAYAMEKPTWVDKGVKALNSARGNDSYSFTILNTHNTDLNRLITNRDRALVDYVVETYGADPASVRTQALPNDTAMYRVTYQTAGAPHSLTAKLVDTYYEIDDYVETYFEFEYYQLYAVSQPDVMPMYDEFKINRTSNSKAVTMSLIPGMGQIYKGQEIKGYTFLGAEIGLLGAIGIFEYKRGYCWRKVSSDPDFADSWSKKSRSWRTFRNLSIVGAVAVYIGNLLDASYSQGSPQVTVGRRGGSFSMLPYIDTEGSGLAFSLTF